MIKIVFNGTLDKEGFVKVLYRECPELQGRKLKWLVDEVGQNTLQIWFIDSQELSCKIEKLMISYIRVEDTKINQPSFTERVNGTYERKIQEESSESGVTLIGERKMADKNTGFLASMNLAMEQLYQEIQDRISELAKLAETAQNQIKVTVAQVSESAKNQIEATTKEIKTYTKDHSAQTEARMKNLEDSLAAQLGTLAGRITALDEATKMVFSKILVRLEVIEKKITAAGQALKE